jgi:uncharacterized delta-60 repeat protein
VSAFPVFGYGPAGVPAIATVQGGGHVVKMLRMPDGSVVVIGDVWNNGSDIALWRVDALGRITPEFGQDGMSQVPVGDDMLVRDATLQADGKIVVVGSSWDAQAMSTRFATVRFNADGSLDMTFGGTGIVTATLSGADEADSVLVQSDGKVVVGGYVLLGGANFEAAFVRYNADGTLDSSFNGNGQVITSLGPATDIFRVMQETADGKLLALVNTFSTGDSSARSIDLLRFNADGTPDSTFGSGGEAIQAIASGPGNSSRGMFVQADGKIVVYGIASPGLGPYGDLTLTRFLPDGTLDSTFGVQGTIDVPATGITPASHQILQQPDGKLLIADTNFDFGMQGELVRLNSDGTLDPTFGDGGRALAPLGSVLTDFALNADGSISATGTFNRLNRDGIDGLFTVSVIRFDANGSLDTSFAPVHAFAREAVADIHDTSVEIAPGAGVFDAGLHFYADYTASTLMVMRHGGAVARDTFGGDGPLALQDGAVLYNQVKVGTYTSVNGILQIGWLPFPSTIPQDVVDGVLQHITWHPQSGAAGTNAQFDWTFTVGGDTDQLAVVATSTVVFSNVVRGTDAGDSLAANGALQALDGGAGNDSLVGSAYNDIVIGGPGNDTLSGGNGGWADTALYNGPLGHYTIEHQPDGSFVINDKTGADGVDVLSGIDRVQFADARIALDIDGNAGQAYRLYQAAFNRVPDLGGLGFQMHALDSGLTLTQVAGNFIASPEFQLTYGNVDDTQFLTLLYRNVLHRAPDEGGLQFHLDEMHNQGQSRALELVHFSESPENQANVLGQIQDGMLYLD